MKGQEKENIYQNKIEQYHTRNFALNVASSGFDNFGLSLVGQSTVLIAFLTLFTRSNLIIGLLPALFIFFWMFPQILSSLYTGHLRQKKNVIVFIRIGYSIPWLILSALTLFVIRPESRFSLPIFFTLYGLFALLGGFAMPMWISLISRLIFRNVRGRFFGSRAFVGTSFGVLASFVVKGVLSRCQYPVNFSLLFLFAFVVFLLGTVALAISKEPLTPYQIRKQSVSEYFSELGYTIRKDRDLAWFIVSTIIRSFGTTMMAAAFYTAYAIYKLGVDLEKVATFMGIMLSARLIGGLVFGRLGELRGPTVVQILSRLFDLLSVGAILLQPDIGGIYIAFGLLGLAQASMRVSYHQMIMELAQTDKVDVYMGLINGIRAPSLAIAPLLGGLLADSFSYKIVFTISLFASLFSALLLSLKVKLARTGE